MKNWKPRLTLTVRCPDCKSEDEPCKWCTSAEINWGLALIKIAKRTPGVVESNVTKVTWTPENEHKEKP